MTTTTMTRISLNPLTGDNPFVDHVPGAAEASGCTLAPLGMVTAAGGGFDVFVDDSLDE